MDLQNKIVDVFSVIMLVTNVLILLSIIFYVVKIIMTKAKIKSVNYIIIAILILLMLVTFGSSIASLVTKDKTTSINLLIVSFVFIFATFGLMLIMFNKIAFVITEEEVYIFSDRISINKIDAIFLDKDRKKIFIGFKNRRNQIKSTSFKVGSKFSKIIEDNIGLLGKNIEETSFENWRKEAQKVGKF